MSQRELAAASGISASTIARAESGSACPSWASMAGATAAAECRLWVVTRSGSVVHPWEFDDATDRAERHLPAHLDTWRVWNRWQWSGMERYQTWASPPVPPVTYRMRDRGEPALGDTRASDVNAGDEGQPEPLPP